MAGVEAPLEFLELPSEEEKGECLCAEGIEVGRGPVVAVLGGRQPTLLLDDLRP